MTRDAIRSLADLTLRTALTAIAIILVIGIVLAGVLAAAFPARRAAGMNVLQALQYE